MATQMINALFMLAQQVTTQPAQQTQSPLQALLQGPFMLVLLVLAALWFFSSRSRRREQQKYQDMLKNLKRNDRVQTIGGIIGTVVDARDDEVVLKVDETNNVKMRFARSAIKDVIRESAPADGN